jgi:Caspase domain
VAAMANNWAIVVGINQYKFLPQAPLKFAVADALAMRSFLCEEAGFKPDQVLLCGDGGEEFSRDSTRSTLRDILLHQIQRAQKADNLWFFFSGHGIDDHLMPMDGNSRDVKDTAISIHFVTDCLRKCKTKNIVMILDMCRNESRDVGRKNVPSIETEIRDLVKQRDGQQGIITLFSCSHGESSYEIADLKQGAFTYALLEGLRTHSILKDLARHLEQRVPELHQSSGKNRKQVPLLIPEPDWKLNDPILSHYATAVDVVQLKEMAIDAECDGDFDRALQLWEQVNLLATKLDDRRRALNKVQDLMSRVNLVVKPIVPEVQTTSEVPLTKGDLGGSVTAMEPIDRAFNEYCRTHREDYDSAEN